MKRTMLFLAAAAAFAACSKNEVALVTPSEDTEITFNVAPRTKALADNQKDFDHKNVFVSYAYYLAPSKTWDADNSEAKPYITGSTISFVGDVWKNAATTYYWPKDGGSLTFFAYSYNKEDMNVTGEYTGFTCVWDQAANKGGINGHIDVETNKNVDFLVADIAKDKTANETTYAHTGVPTLFRHRLSWVNVYAKLAENYDNKKFTINSIKFQKIHHYATYNQIPESMTTGGTSDLDDQIYAENAGFVVNSGELVKVAPVIKGGTTDEEGQYIYIPQVFGEDSYLEVSYTIETTVADGSVVTENCVKKVPVKDVFAQWEMGHRYTINITFTLNEILWDPAVQEWIDDAAGSITID